MGTLRIRAWNHGEDDPRLDIVKEGELWSPCVYIFRDHLDIAGFPQETEDLPDSEIPTSYLSHHGTFNNCEQYSDGTGALCWDICFDDRSFIITYHP